MKNFALVALLAIAIGAAAASAQGPPMPVKLVWEDMFAPPYAPPMPEIAMAISCVSPKMCFLAGGSNGVGFGVFKYDGEMNGNVTKMHEPNMTMMILSVAAAGTFAEPKGAFAGAIDFTVGKGLQYLAKNAKEWLPSKMPWELVWVSDSIQGTKDGSHFVALGEAFQSDFMVSTDGAKTFSNVPFTYQAPQDKKNCSSPGFLAMPSVNAWYVSYGAEPQSNNNAKVNSHYFDDKVEKLVSTKHQGRLLVIRNKKTGADRTHFKTPTEYHRDLEIFRSSVDANKCNYYFGAILKSTDQGKSWKELYVDAQYNADTIACGSENNCAAVGYNGQETYVVVTKDGGATWNKTLTTPPGTREKVTSISAIGYADATEIWAGGAEDNGRDGSGVFWYSTNSGNTWTKNAVAQPNILAIMAMEFIDGVGFAVGMSAFKTSTILRYKKQPEYSYFKQAHCPIKGCTILCQNISFPQGMCLGGNGDSAKAFCTPSGVEQYVYETTSCLGNYTKHVQAVNQCLKGNDGSYFENYCPPPTSERVTVKKPQQLLRRTF